MMTIARLKRLVLSVGVVFVAGAIVIGVAAMSAAVVLAGTGADPGEAFTDPDLRNTAAAASTVWDPDPGSLDRPVDPRMRDELALAWRDAVALLERRSEGEAVDLSRRFSADLVAVFGPTEGRPTDVDVLSHRLRVEFVSMDGQVVGMRARTTSTRTIGDRQVLIDDVYEATFVQRAAGWTIAAFNRIDSLTNS